MTTTPENPRYFSPTLVGDDERLSDEQLAGLRAIFGHSVNGARKSSVLESLVARAEEVLANAPRSEQQHSAASWPIGRTAEDIRTTVPVELDWLIPGVIARGWTVKLAGREKRGKGTLVTYLIGKLERGEPTVFGPACSAPVKSLIFTEEPEDALAEKLRAFSLSEATILNGYAFAGCGWEQKVKVIVAAAIEAGAELIFVDNISRAAMIEDESGRALGHAVEYLSDLARTYGLAVIFDHHHKKGAGALEDKSRGGTATGGATDNNLELEAVRGAAWTDRTRRVSSRGRLTATNWQRTIELTEDHADYRELEADEFDLETCRAEQLADFEDGATAREFAERTGLSHSRAQGALRELVDEGLATVDESKRPYTYSATPEPKL